MPKDITALIFISTEPKSMQIPTENELIKIKEIKHVYEVLGNYDICVEVKAKSREELGKILYSISTIRGVKAVTTFIISKKVK